MSSESLLFATCRRLAYATRWVVPVILLSLGAASAQDSTVAQDPTVAPLDTALPAPAAVAPPVEEAASPPTSVPEGPGVVIDRVIATVGGELLLLSELQEQLALMASQEGKKITPQVRCRVLESLMTSKLLVNQAKLDSIEISDEEVESQLDARFERILSMMNDDITQFEEYYGQTVSEVRLQFRDDLRDQMLSERMRNEVSTGARMTPSEVKGFFNEIPRDSLPYFNSEVEIRELLYKPKVNPEQRALALEEIEEIKAALAGGADFADLAQKRSDDPGSGRDGGNLGWAPRGTFVPEFEAAAYRLDVNEVSDVVETPFGFHLIQLLERRGNRIRARHILIKPKIVAADLARAEVFLDSIRALVLVDSMSFQAAVRLHGDDEIQSYSNGGRVTNPVTGNTFFEISDLDPVAFFAIDTLDVDGITGPVRFEAPGGAQQDPFYKLFQLDSRSAPHLASLALDYDKIRAAAVDAKQATILDDWVGRTIGETYIQVDRSLVRDCGLEERWFMDGATALQP